VSDSITSISCCEFAVRQVVQLVVRLAVCSKTCCGSVVQQVVRLAVRLADCCMQLGVDLLRTCCWLSIYCGFVVQLVVEHAVQQAVQQVHNKSMLVESDTYTHTHTLLKIKQQTCVMKKRS